MFAIVETGGNQFRVAPGNKINVEKIEGNEGSKITLDNVLFVQKEDGSALIGKPLLENVKVEAETKTKKLLTSLREEEKILEEKMVIDNLKQN